MRLIRNIKTWFGNQLISNKIVIVYIPLIIIPLFILGFATNRIYTNVITKQTINNISDNSKLIITQIEGIFTNAESSANILTLNLNRIYSQNLSKLNELQLYTQITNQIGFAQLIFPDVASAAFIDTNGTIYGSHPLMEVHVSEVINSNLAKEIDKTRGANIWFPMQRRSFLTMNVSNPVLTLGKKVFNIQTGQPLGWLILNINETKLSSIYKTINSNPLGTYFITDPNGLVVSSQHPMELLKPVTNGQIQSWIQSSSNNSRILPSVEGNVLLTSNEFPHLHWKLITKTPIEVLTRDYHKITLLIIYMGIACLVIALIGANVLSRVVANPVKRLAKVMLRVREGNFNVASEVHTTDEIGYLATGFNTMIVRIRELLDKVNFEQRKKREYELALIQAQIKPHFLYNTLDVIYTLSEMGRVKDVQRTTKALADFYRVALSQGKEMITIREELDNIRDYLSIQRIRYSDVFDYEINVTPGVLDSPILKLTIQPIVENAIYHGLKTKSTFGHIRIEGDVEEDRIRIHVIDDGVGISEDKLRELLTESEDGPKASFGLYNVNNRIKLYFGEQYGLDLSSEVGKGTKVSIVLPIQERGRNA